MEVEEYRKSDESYYENRARVILTQNEISKLIFSNIHYYGENFKNNKEDPIHLSEALKLSIIYKNIGG